MIENKSISKVDSGMTESTVKTNDKFIKIPLKRLNLIIGDEEDIEVDSL
jgi:hypothetical protein